MLEFKETFGITIPNVEEQLKPFSESEFSESHGLVIDVAAIHEGVTNNFNHYSAEELEASLESWTKPYPKPILLNHDVHSEPLGRVMGARMDKESDGTFFTRLQVAITDPVAVEKVASKRYLTGSIGGMSKQAICSVCEIDWASSTEMVPCEHKRGKPYKGKMAWLDRRDISNKEWSFVNMPSDERSAVLDSAAKAAVAESEDGWVRPVRFFIINMNEQEVMNCDQKVDVLTGMDKKDILPFYQGLKGSFLLASAAAGLEESENSKENNTMAESKEDTTVAEDDDILKISGELSAELAEADQDNKTSDEDSEATENADVDENAGDDKKEEAEVDQTSDESENKDEPAPEKADEEEADKADDDEKSDKDAPTEEQKAEGQEKTHDKDVDPENSDDAPKSREAEDSEATKDDADKLDDTKDDSVDESELADLKTQVATLKEENGKLRTALHNTLVERVVDAKIVVGLVEREDRQDAIEEHSQRTAASLKDSLLDIATLPVQASTNVDEAVQIDEKIVVDGEDSVVTIGEEAQVKRNPEEVLEGILTDVLMGRRVL